MMSDTQTFDAAAYTALGTTRERVALPATPFDGVVNVPVMHQAVKAFLANQRAGTAFTRTRGLVTGGNQKPWKQKGTGRARQGSTRAPHWPGGGTVFGPHGDRNYSEKVPKQVRYLAKKSALNARAREGAVFLVDRFTYDAPNTQRLLGVLTAMGVADQKVLVLTDGSKPSVYLSARNISNVHALPFSDASTYHILWSDVVVIEATALGQELAPVAETAAVKSPKAKAAKPAAAPTAPKAAAKKPAAKKAPAATKAPAAKKAAAKKTVAKKAAPKKKES